MILTFSDDEEDIYNGILEVMSNSKSLVINEHHKSRKMFIITTNLSLQELPDRQGQSK